jgi:hypothetical protein
VALTPAQDAPGGQSLHRLRVENRGNTVVRADLEATATADVGGTGERVLTVGLEPPTLTLEPGASAKALVTVVGTTTRTPRGATGVHRFEVVVRPVGAPDKTVVGRLPTTSRRPARRAPALVGLVAVLVAGGFGLRATVLAPDEQDRPPAGDAASDADCPAQGRIGSASHGDREQPPATGYTFLSADDGEGCFPARFNPCAPVPYVLNDALAPPGGVEEVRAAIDRVSEATGLSFTYEGTSDEPLAISRDAYQPQRYGQRWAPILIGWSALGAEAQPGATNDVIVVGRGRPLPVDNVLVSGVLELNVDAVRDRASGAPLPGGFGQGVTTGRVILHELGHVVGLGHPSSRGQLMFADLAAHTLPTAEFGIGDRSGLRLLGAAAGCVDVPPLPLGPATPR